MSISLVPGYFNKTYKHHIHSLANLAVPGYANHKYNVVNFAFYLPERNPPWLADATSVWNNPGNWMSASFKQELTGSSSATASQLRTAIKRTYITPRSHSIQP